MPYSIFTTLHLDNLKIIDVVVQLADHSNVYPRGVLEDVLVQTNELVFLANFFVLDMEDEDVNNPTPLLLGPRLSSYWYHTGGRTIFLSVLVHTGIDIFRYIILDLSIF